MNIKRLVGIIGAVIVFSAFPAYGATILFPTGGGTGWGNLQLNTVLLGNGTNQVATTSAGTNGQSLTLVSGVPTWVSTTTFSTGLTYSSGTVTCVTASASLIGCLSTSDWSAFNSKLGAYDAWTHPQTGTSATTSAMLLIASTTIGDGSQTGGLTVSGWATTSGNVLVQGSATSTFNYSALFGTNGGNVGIGTSTNFASALIASGVSPFLATSTIGPYNTFSVGPVTSTFTRGSTNTGDLVFIKTPDNSAGRSALHVKGNNGAVESLWVASNGPVGVGTTSPASILDVEGTNNASGGLTFGSTAGTVTNRLAMYSTGNTSFEIQKLNANVVLSFNNSVGNEELRLNNNGFMGIATTSPYARLSISHGSSGTVIAADAASSFSGTLLDLKVASTSVFTVGAGGAITSTALTASTLPYASTTDISFGTNADIFSPSANKFQVRANGSSITWDGSAFAPVTDSVKNLGIDSTNRWNFLYANYASTTAMSATTICISTDCKTAWPGGLATYDAWTHAQLGMSATTSAIGIGTTTPFSQLSVSSSTVGNANTSLFAVASNTAATLFNILGSGNVGVGTTSPGTLFSINGSANFTTGTSTILGNGLLAPRLNTTATSSLAGLQLNTGGLTIPTLTNSGLGVNASGVVYAAATTTYSTGLTYAAGAVTCNTATASVFGCLPSADWTTFNNKQGPGFQISTTTIPSFATGNLAYITGTSPTTLGGVATSSISLGTSLSVTGGSLGAQVGGTALTINTVQAITTGSSPTFAGLTLTSFSGAVSAAAGVLSAGTLSLANGGTNATTFTTSGNAVYYDGTRLVTAPSTTFVTTPFASSTSFTSTSGTWLATTGGVVGIATTSPWALLSINANALTTDAFAIGSTTSSLFAINKAGGITLAARQPATTTSITLDWSNSQPLVEYQIGAAAVTIHIINATTTYQWGSRKVVSICNPNETAGALTWDRVEWIGTAPAQTTTANQCDFYSFLVTRATSTSAYRIAGTAGTGFQ